MTKEAGAKDPLHGLTLEQILKELVTTYGWEQLGAWVNVDCFVNKPSINSSLKMLRKVSWARAKVEKLYIEMKPREAANRKNVAAAAKPEIKEAVPEVVAPAPKKVSALGPEFKEVSVCVRAQVKLLPNMDKPAVEAALRHKVETFFEAHQIAGCVLMVSEISNALMGVDGIEKLESFNMFCEDEGARGPRPKDIKFGKMEFPVQGRVVILLR